MEPVCMDRLEECYPAMMEVDEPPTCCAEEEQVVERTEERAVCLVEYLPLEIFMRIASFLDKELVAFGKVCKFLNQVAFQELFDRGMHNMEVLQDNFKAIQEFTQAICLNPSSPCAYFKRGVAHYKECEEEDAVRDIGKALQLGPNEVEEHIMKAMLYQIQLNFDQAVVEATKAIELDPYNGAAYYLRGYNRFDLQDYDGSIQDLSFCLTLPYPYKSKVLNCRGWCYKIRGDVDKALADFTQSSRSNVRYTKPFVNKAIVISGRKDRPACIEEEQFLTRYLASTKESNLGAIYYTRAAIRQQWENYEGAIEDYKLAIENQYHSLHKAYVSVGWCYEKLNQYENAILEYNKAAEIKPTYSIAIEHRAGAKCRTDSKAAEDDCKLAISVNPKNLSFAYRYLAAVQADNNEYVQAIATLSDGIKVNPLDTDMLLNRAGYYTCQGNFSAAIADYNLCLKHRPDTYEAWKYRGNVKFACGDLLGASMDYTNALRIEPEDGAVLNNCGVCFMGLGSLDKSMDFITKAIQLPDIPSVPENNMRLIRYIQAKGQLPKLFDPQIITDPVFEKDLEKKMKEATRANILSTLKNPAPHDEIMSLKQRVLLWKRRNS